MDQDQSNAIKTESGPNAPTQVDKVSTTEVKPDTNNTTELNKPEAETKESLPETSGTQESDGKTLIYIYSKLTIKSFTCLPYINI